MIMARLLFVLLLLFGARSAMGQNEQFDYLNMQITSSGAEVKVISTETETRVVRIDFPKGQGSIEPSAKVILALVQEY